MTNPIANWWRDPQASATIAVALVAGIFAVYQLRSFPSERRQRILRTMRDLFDGTAKGRGFVLGKFPPLLALAYDAVSQAMASQITELEAARTNKDVNVSARAEKALNRLRLLRRDASVWTRQEVGLSYTGAGEILSSEFKFRSFLWCIEVLDGRRKVPHIAISTEDLRTAEAAGSALNAFAMEYENGNFLVRSMFGQWHVGIARSVKALEPIVWFKSAKGARWGRRLLKLGIAAQHYNDISPIHRVSDLTWTSSWDGTDRDMIVHPALTQDIMGHEVLTTPIPDAPRLLPLLRLRFRSEYWRLVGGLNLTPRLWFLSIGGRRLRAHKRHENRLASALRFAAIGDENSVPYDSLDWGWDLKSLVNDMEGVAKAALQGRGQGRFRWFYYSRRPQADS